MSEYPGDDEELTRDRVRKMGVGAYHGDPQTHVKREMDELYADANLSSRGSRIRHVITAIRRKLHV